MDFFGVLVVWCFLAILGSGSPIVSALLHHRPSPSASHSCAPGAIPTVDLGYTIHSALINATAQYYNFSNVRYAAPPLGPLRFKAPVKPTEINRTVDDGTTGRICPQAQPAWAATAAEFIKSILTGTNFTDPENPSDSMTIPPVDPRTTEDCLFLDVIVPQTVFDSVACSSGIKPKPKSTVPVIIWLYGGGYTTGDKTSSGSPAELLAESLRNGNEGIIFVAPNYRLGLFGWLSGPTFQKDGTSNAGLLDQRLAFEWVKEYIHLFGGDSSRVTVMGESAGAGSIMHHITAYGGKGGPVPFQQALPQSPAYQPTLASQQEHIFAEFLAIAKEVANATTLQQVRRLPTMALQVINGIQVGRSSYGSFTFGPAVDGAYVPSLPPLLLQNGRFHKHLTVMTAHNFDEGLIFSSPYVQNQTTFEAYIAGLYPEASPSIISYISETLYPPNFDGTYGYLNEVERTALFYSESQIICNSNFINRAFRNETYSYLFNVSGGLHGQDVSYTFYDGPGVDSYGLPINSTVAAILQAYEVNFALHGNPNGPGSPQFGRYTAHSQVQDLTSKGISPVTDPAANPRCNWWQQAFYA
ncbi:alpha/beta-hydrolase [Lipomyces doorenjongii]